MENAARAARRQCEMVTCGAEKFRLSLPLTVRVIFQYSSILLTSKYELRQGNT